MPPPQRPQLHPTLQCMASPGRKTNCEDEGTLPSNKMAPKTRMHRTDSREASFPIPSRPRVARGSAGPGPGRGSAVGKGPREALAGLLVVRSRRLLAHLSLTAIRSGDGGATAGAAPRGSRRPGGRRDSGSAGSPWWTPHPERGPQSWEPRPPPQGGGGSSLGRGDPSLSLHHPHSAQQPATGSGRQWKPEWGWEAGGEGAAEAAAGVEHGGPGGERGSRDGGASLRDAAERKRGCSAGGCRAPAAGGGGVVPPEPSPPSPARPPAAAPPAARPARPSGAGRTGEGPAAADSSRQEGARRGGGRAQRAPRRAGERDSGPEEMRGAAAGPPASRAQLQLRGPPPHARQRGAARGAAEALTPPAPSAGAARAGGAAGAGREVVPRDFSRTPAFPGGERARGTLPSEYPGGGGRGAGGGGN
jgi:hypothetical protein